MKVLPNPFYYLDNFQKALDWVAERYGDLLLDREAAWISSFRALPQNARALLVRFVMRKGTLFRSTKSSYEEIGSIEEAVKKLIHSGWIDDRPLLKASELFTLLNKPELALILQGRTEESARARKAELYEVLQAYLSEPVPFDLIFPQSGERIYRLSPEIAAFCERVKLMFFGNPYQEWTEFVLADLGIHQYENVAIDAQSRAFQCREDIDTYLHLHDCRKCFHEGEAPDTILPRLPKPSPESWLASHHAKLVYQIAYHYEQAGHLDKALELYQGSVYPGARLRSVRVLEKTGMPAAAYELALEAQRFPENEEELQQLQRIMPRIQRKLGLPGKAAVLATPLDKWRLALPCPAGKYGVEEALRRHLDQVDAPAYYVENALINSLFGLLCWEAVFHPLCGAFFHPFHSAPADLHRPDFYQRRRAQFDFCLSRLDSQDYKAAIYARFEEKNGIQSPFVFWSAIDRNLLELALECIPAEHLRRWFVRILQDVKRNRAGFPDLIQFWPREKRYRMIEVKGPGDRMQDNQVRQLSFARTHDMPVAVCYVDWLQGTKNIDFSLTRNDLSARSLSSK